MSIVKDNIVTRGLSGKLGKQIVFRQWSGATFLAKAPVMSSSFLNNEVIVKNKLRFKAATGYAKRVMNDPALKQVYKSRCKARQNAYAKAIQDFYGAPEIEEIDLSNYTGEANSFIRVYATENFRVDQVRVMIENEQNQEVESGFATQEENTDWWKFIVSGTHILSSGGKVVVTASDLPGNETTKEANI